jgi:CubicO group peptidase (beta-lactamase class C family)
VRIVLNHTSGLPDYASNPSYTAYLLQHPLHRVSSADYLGYLTGTMLDSPAFCCRVCTRPSSSISAYLLFAVVAFKLSGAILLRGVRDLPMA